MYGTIIHAAVVACALLATAFAVMAFTDIKTAPSAAPSSGKADLLRRPAASAMPYVLVETRGGGVSVVRRVR